MTALLVTSAVGAGMLVNVPAQRQDVADVTFDSCNVVNVAGIDVTALATGSAEIDVYNTTAGTYETITIDSEDRGGIVEVLSATSLSITLADQYQIQSIAFVGILGDGVYEAPEECGPEGANVDYTCGVDGAMATVTNDNDAPITVEIGGDASLTETIAAGESLTFEGVADGEYNVTTIVDGREIATETVVVDCPAIGEVDVDVQCGVDGATVTVSNENDVAVDVDVGGRTLTLAPGENQTYTGVQNNEFDVTTLYDGTEVGVQTVVVDCLTDSEVSVEVVCGADGANATVTNDNDVPVTIEVSGDASLTETIAAGENLTFENVPDGEYNVTTIVGGEVVGETTVVVDCADDGDNGDGDAGDGDNGDGDAGDGDDGDDGDAGDGDDGDGDMGDGEMPAYQIDVAAGQVIENLGVDGDDADDEKDFYGTQGRLLQAQTVLADGTVTGSYMVPGENVTKSLAGCHVSYTPVSYDGETGEVTLSVSVDGDADCEGVTLTLAGYELPGDDTTFVRANADGQELVDYQTVTLGAGDSGTVTIDLDGDDSEATA